MCAFMSYQMAPINEYLITDLTGIRSLTITCALMSYQFSLLTECLITHITNIWTPTPIYVTGISAFSIVYVNLFIQSILVKTQRLNIRIYSDTKNK